MEYLGIDWSYRRAAWCSLSDAGVIVGEGAVPADADGLARLVIERGTDVRAVVEMMSGAIWVRDELAAAGWRVQIAHARKVRDVAPLACKTDKVDARVLAELARRDLVPELWVSPLEDRALRERLRRRTHLVRMRASAMNRIFGLQTQWGLRLSLRRLRGPDAMTLLERQGMPAVWRRSIAEALDVIDLLDARITPIDHELRPLARADARVILLDTIPGIGDLLGLTLASRDRRRRALRLAAQADRLRRPGAEDQPVRRPLAHRRALQGRLADPALGRRRSGPTRVATDQPVAPALHRSRRAGRQEPGQGRRRAQDPDRRLARPVAPATLQARRPAPARSCLGKLPLLSGRLTALHGIETPRPAPTNTLRRPERRKRNEPTSTATGTPRHRPTGRQLTNHTRSKRRR